MEEEKDIFTFISVEKTAVPDDSYFKSLAKSVISTKKAEVKIIPLYRKPFFKWAVAASQAFRNYFPSIANARVSFVEALTLSGYQYIASARSVGTATATASDDDARQDADDSEEEE